jgi:hypothetical protein
MKIDKMGCTALMVAFIGLFPVIAFPADRPAEKTAKKEVGQGVQETVESIKAYSAEQRDAAVKKGKAVIEDLDVRIERMKSKINQNWEQMDASARKKASAALEAIQKQRSEIAEWYGSLKLKESSSSAWENAKNGFVKSYEAIHDSFEKTAEKF